MVYLNANNLLLMLELNHRGLCPCYLDCLLNEEKNRKETQTKIMHGIDVAHSSEWIMGNYLRYAFDGFVHFLNHVAILLESFVNWNALHMLNRNRWKKNTIRFIIDVLT